MDWMVVRYRRQTIRNRDPESIKFLKLEPPLWIFAMVKFPPGPSNIGERIAALPIENRRDTTALKRNPSWLPTSPVLAFDCPAHGDGQTLGRLGRLPPDRGASQSKPSWTREELMSKQAPQNRAFLLWSQKRPFRVCRRRSRFEWVQKAGPQAAIGNKIARSRESEMQTLVEFPR